MLGVWGSFLGIGEQFTLYFNPAEAQLSVRALGCGDFDLDCVGFPLEISELFNHSGEASFRHISCLVKRDIPSELNRLNHIVGQVAPRPRALGELNDLQLSLHIRNMSVDTLEFTIGEERV